MNVFKGKESNEKYNDKKIHSALVNHFMKALLDLANKTGEKEILEMGCGEGQLCGVLYENGYQVKGFDISERDIATAKDNFKEHGMEIQVAVGNIYHYPIEKKFPVVICCEVLEHLEDPRKALEIIVSAAEKYVIVSVPREPVWCLLNLFRGKYLKTLGNTPGHINHWSKRKFIEFLQESGATVAAVRTPLPWTMVLLKKNRYE